MIDEFTRECIAIRIGRRLRSSLFLVCCGPEFAGRMLDQWAFLNKVELDFSRPGKPTDNAFIESFNGKFRTECPNAHWFMSLPDAREKVEAWRRDYNELRPYSAIGNKPPISLVNRPPACSPR